MSELGKDARELIDRALRDEIPADQAELASIRRRVLAASAGASALGVAGKAMAVLGKASLGPVLKAFAVGVAVTVLAIGLPMVLDDQPEAKRRAIAPARPSLPKVVSPSGGLPPAASPTTLAAPVTAASVREPLHVVARGAAAGVASRPVAAPPPVATPATPAPPAVEVGTRAPTVGTNVQVSEGFATTPGQAQSFSVPASAPKPQKSPLVQELTLLENVQSELRAGHGAAALRLLDGSSFPEGGQLQAERLAAEVFASCQAGDAERARTAARLFLRRYPSSPASGRVRGSCGGEEAGNAR